MAETPPSSKSEKAETKDSSGGDEDLEKLRALGKEKIASSAETEGIRGKIEDYCDRVLHWSADYRRKKRAAIETRRAELRESKEKKKAAARAMGNMTFGVSLLGAGILLALAGTVALPFWGMKKILQADKDFMKAFNWVSGQK